jgi:hypothetical protein
MRLIAKPARWMCLPTAFAMALDIPLAAIFDEIGHDGSQIVEPDLPEPTCRRGFHPQELIDVCMAHGYAATRVELYPVLLAVPDGGPYTVAYPSSIGGNWGRFTRAIENSYGVIEGVGRHCNHAVAYDHGHIFDPDGCGYPYSRAACENRGFYTQHLWRVDKIGGAA